MTVKRPRRPLALLGAAALALPATTAATGLLRSPHPNVPDWLHVSTTDRAACTPEIQVTIATLIVVCGAAIVTMAVLRRLRKAVAALAGLAYAIATAVFAMPMASLGARNAYPPIGAPGSPGPIPVRTDFDYRAYLPDLLATITAPALWAATATLPLGLAVAAAVHLNRRRRRAPATADPAPSWPHATLLESSASNWAHAADGGSQAPRPCCGVTLRPAGVRTPGRNGRSRTPTN